MALAYDNSSSGSGNSVATVSFAHICSGVERLLVALVGFGDAANKTISTITYAGVNMTQVSGTATWASGWTGTVPICYLINPATGSNTFTVTLNAASNTIGAGVVSFTGAHQTYPVVERNVNGIFAAPPSTITIASVAGRIVAGCTMTDADTTMTITSGVSRQTKFGLNGTHSYALGTIDGGGTLSWTWTAAQQGWAINAAEIVPSIAAAVFNPLGHNIIRPAMNP
jgi:hypothetical protein